jgi:hypothetical protein
VSEQPDLGRADADVSDTTVSDAGQSDSDNVDDNVSGADYPDESTSDPWQTEGSRRPTQSGGSDV